ncbi:hypothetical protein [Candidatus Enterococcus murrayae]|uniref:Uncharacterized protein n=1 Tax=Candidatus Enterococcus murrayae TaxID=2815321 RepID=A0ABS3HNT6_9ENTE|nr:hypothetical protein [Enterococcus sp. MJM16]MBO0455122.1 hypothetical protein [Enterococcus sp. MJM16]
MKKGGSSFRKEVQAKIKSLTFTSDETKSVYQKQAAQCKNKAELRKLLKVIELGEQQLYAKQKSLFQTLEASIWKINELRYLPMSEKAQWVEKLVACDSAEEMSVVYARAVEAEKKAGQSKAGSWTVLNEQ